MKTEYFKRLCTILVVVCICATSLVIACVPASAATLNLSGDVTGIVASGGYVEYDATISVDNATWAVNGTAVSSPTAFFSKTSDLMCYLFGAGNTVDIRSYPYGTAFTLSYSMRLNSGQYKEMSLPRLRIEYVNSSGVTIGTQYVTLGVDASSGYDVEFSLNKTSGAVGARFVVEMELQSYEYAESSVTIATITASSVNVREGAGGSYPAVTVYHSGESYEILETTLVSGNTWGRTTDGWFRITGYANLTTETRETEVESDNFISIALTDLAMTWTLSSEQASVDSNNNIGGKLDDIVNGTPDQNENVDNNQTLVDGLVGDLGDASDQLGAVEKPDIIVGDLFPSLLLQGFFMTYTAILASVWQIDLLTSMVTILVGFMVVAMVFFGKR